MRIGTGRLAAVLAFVVVVVGSIVSSLGVSQGIRPDTITPATIDFDETVYYPALAFANGENPYDPGYVSRYAVDNPFPPYAPITLLIHQPLTLVCPNSHQSFLIAEGPKFDSPLQLRELRLNQRPQCP